MGRYLMIAGKGVPALVVGPFPEGYNPLNFQCPAGYTVAESHETREEAEESALWFSTMRWA